ncbi:MAG: VOC family protein, partial [Chloroflexi bacterium]|nr:VOC family protein [Chloroflexota bacterium]
ASLAKVEELGGKTVRSKTEIPNTGWFAIFTDPTGNTIALFTNTER